MTDSGTITQRRHLSGWLFLTAFLLAVPVTFIVASYLSQPHWDWSTSWFGRFTTPLLWVEFFGCIASPFMIPLRPLFRVGIAAAAACVFGGMMLASSVLCMLFFGSPAR
jgi:hypothetical protein